MKEYYLFSPAVWLVALLAAAGAWRLELHAKPFPRALIASGAIGFAASFVLVGVVADPNGVRLFERHPYEAAVIVVGGFLYSPVAAFDLLFFSAQSGTVPRLVGIVLLLVFCVGSFKRRFRLARASTYVSIALWLGLGTAWFCLQA